MKTPKEFLCKKCLKKFREYDTQRKKVWRIKIKQTQKQESGKIKIKKVRLHG